jgi:hypothetical protein
MHENPPPNNNAYVDAKTYRADSTKPERNIEILPIQLFFALNGSFSEPYLLPTMSANPEKLMRLHILTQQESKCNDVSQNTKKEEENN